MSDPRDTYMTAADLLRATLDALEYDPCEEPVDVMHPQDAHAAAEAALRHVAGMFIANTTRAFSDV